MESNSVQVSVGREVYIAPTAYVGGDVTLGDQCVVMHHVTIRGDVSAIRIGRRVNFQDGVIVHTRSGVPLDIGDDVSVGHRAVVHCRRVGAGTLIGTGAIVLDDCEIGERCIIGAGAVVPPKTVIPDGKLVLGVPGKVIRDVNDSERGYMQVVVESYLRLGPLHAAGRFPAYHPQS